MNDMELAVHLAHLIVVDKDTLMEETDWCRDDEGHLEQVSIRVIDEVRVAEVIEKALRGLAEKDIPR